MAHRLTWNGMIVGKWLMVGVLLVSTLSLLGSCGGSPPVASSPSSSAPVVAPAAQPAPKQEVINIRLVHHMTPDYVQYRLVPKFAKLVEEQSKGAVKFEIFPAESLIKTADFLESVSSGRVEAAVFPEGTGSGVIPAIALSFLPISKDRAGLKTLLSNPDAKTILGKEYANRNVKSLAWGTWGWSWFATTAKKEGYRPEDFKGLKIRVAATTDAKLMQLVGAAPATLASAEIYTAAQRGTIDGAFSNYDNMISRNLFEVFKYMPDAQLSGGTWQFIMNKTLFDKMSPELQKIITEAATQIYQQEAFDAAFKRYDELKVELVQKRGMIIRDLTPEDRAAWMAVMGPVFEDYRQKAGTAGQQLLEVAKKLNPEIKY